MNELTPEQSEQIANAIAAGRKIEAIKLYRRFTGSELKDSKEFIEKLTVQLHERDPMRFPAAGKGCLVMLVTIPVLLLVHHLLQSA